jgi:TonB-linked SusC/RagA family outer membrane protein
MNKKPAYWEHYSFMCKSANWHNKQKLLFTLILFFSITTSLFAQTKTITGKVRDDKGQPLSGVSIVVKGATTGTNSDNEGYFSLTVPGNANTLVVSSIGYSAKEVTLNDQTSLDIQMGSTSQSLGEVVVVAYGTATRKTVTGAVQTVSGKELQDIPAPQLAQKLQGKLAGVQINQTTGIPGQGMSIRIRGQASISAGSDPLYVVDGFPIQGNLANINPDEIETISVLKDASSTSLYGSRAANGVVLITTKRAKAGRSSFSFNAYTGIQSIPSYGRPDMMNASEFAQFQKEIAEERGQAVPDQFKNPQQYGEGTNWFDAVTRDALLQNYTLNYSAAGEKFGTSIVAGYHKTDGVLLNSSYSRISLRANSDYKISNRVKVGFNLAPTFTSNKTPQSDGIWYNSPSIVQSAILASPLAPYKNEDGSVPIGFGWGSPYGGIAAPNWYNQVQVVKNTSKNVGLLSNAFVEVQPLRGLTYRSNIGIDLGNSVSDFFFPSTAGSIFDPPNEGDAARIRGSHGNSYGYSWMWENTLSYAKSLGDHNFDILAGYTSQAAHSESGFMNGTGFPDNRIQSLNAAKTITGTTDIQDWTLASIVSRVNYNFRSKYILSAAIRRDGSSRFGSDNKWGSFPSASVGWVLSDESFMPKINAISFIKLRASYGVTGNNNIPNYLQYANVVATNNPFNNQYLNGRSIAGLNNTELGWETTKQFDAGIDVNLFNNRVRFAYDYYKKTTDNLLYSVEIPISSGFYNFTTNIGKLGFWGHEFSVSSDNLRGALRWTTDFNISFNRNKALALGTANAAIYGDMTITEVGKPLGQLYGLVWDGIYETQKEFDESPKHQGAEVGSVKYKDINGDGIVTNDQRDQTVIGSAAPKFILGFTNNLSFKGFDLAIVGQGGFGNKIINVAERFTANLDGAFNVTKDVANRWRSEANPGDGKYGKASGNTGPERDWGSSKWMYDGDYLTIKNITLGYNFSAHKNKYLRGLRLYTSIQQAYVFTSYPGGNPEVSAAGGLFSGLDYTTYPVPRTYTLGLNMNF